MGVSMSTSDQNRELLERARGRDRGAFEQLFASHADRLEYYVRLRLGDRIRQRVEVDDVLQEVALRAYRSLDRFRLEKEGSLLGWLKGIAEHVILEVVSAGRRDRAVPLSEDTPEDSRPSQATVLRRDERFNRLQDAFDSLAPDHRKVILLARLERLPLDVVAERMGRSPTAVKQLLWRALKKLRANFGETKSFHLPDRRLADGGALHEE